MDQIGCKEEDVAWNMTTTNRRGTKTSTIFSVFRLTRIGQELILRIADFGERGRARAGFSVSGGITGLEATSPPSTKQQKTRPLAVRSMRRQGAAVKPSEMRRLRLAICRFAVK